MEEKLKEFEEKFSYAFIGDFANAEIQEIKNWIAENFTIKASQLEPLVSKKFAELVVYNTDGNLSIYINNHRVDWCLYLGIFLFYKRKQALF